jgi:hypothetical protein
MIANFRSLKNKLHYFKSYVKYNNVSIVLGCETWFDSTVTERLIDNNFIVYRNDRNSHGGGVLICISNAIKSTLLEDYKSDSIECVFVQMFVNSKKYLLGSLYASPRHNKMKVIEELENIFLKIEDKNIFDGIISGRDLNLNLFESNNYITKFGDILDNFGYSQKISEYTYPINAANSKNKSLLDLLITNRQDLISEINVTYNISPTYDHKAILAIFNTEINLKKKPVYKSIPIYNESVFNKINNKLNDVNWDLLIDCNSVDITYKNFIDYIQKILKEEVHNKLVKGRDNAHSRFIRKKIIEKRKLFRKYEKTGRHCILEKFEKLYKEIGEHLIEEFSLNLTNKIEKKESFYKLYKQIKKETSSTSVNCFEYKNDILIDSVSIANAFNTHFISNFHQSSQPTYGNSICAEILEYPTITTTNVLREIQKLKNLKAILLSLILFSKIVPLLQKSYSSYSMILRKNAFLLN